jgi:hypothetical protein
MSNETWMVVIFCFFYLIWHFPKRRNIKMRVWTNSRFESFIYIPSIAIVVADSVEKATEMLNNALDKQGLPKSAKIEDMVELKTEADLVLFMSNGDY